MKIKRLLLAGLGLALGSCANMAETGGAQGPAETVFATVGVNSVGEACRVANDPSAAANPGEEHFAVYCGSWETPSGSVVRIKNGGAPQPGGSLWYRAVDKRMLCEDGREAAVLAENHPARLYECHLKQGGWAMIALSAKLDGDAYLATGIPVAAPPLETTIGLLSGRVRSASEQRGTSAAIAQIEARLGNRQFTAGDMVAYDELMDVASYYNSVGNFAASERYYRDALVLLERTRGANDPSLADPMMRLGLALSNQGRFEEADLMFTRAAGLAQRDYDVLTAPRLRLLRAMHYLHRRRCPEALGEVRAGQGMLVDIANRAGRDADAAVLSGSRAEARVELALSGAVEGAIHLCLNDLDAAEEAVEDAIDVLEDADVAPREWRPIFLSLNSEIARRRESYRDGQSYLTQALDERERLFDPGRPQALDYLYLGEIQALEGRDEEALAAYRRGVAILREQNDGVILDQLLPYMDILARKANREPARREAYAREMFEAGQIVRSTGTSRTIAETAARLASGNQAVSRLIRDLQDNGRRVKELTLAIDAALARPDAERREEEIEAMRAERARLKAQRRGIDAQVQAAAPTFNHLVARPVELAGVVPLVRNDEALIQILLGSNRSVAFLVTSQGVTARFVDIGAFEAGESVEALRRGLIIGEDQLLHGFDRILAHEIYRAFLAPFERQLAGKTHLVSVPTGPYLSLPFSLLVRRAPQAGEGYGATAWLAKDMSVSVVPSMRSFVDLRGTAKASRAAKPFAGFGDFTVPVSRREAPQLLADPCMSRLMGMARHAPALPETRAELNAVADILGGGTGSVHLQSDFTERAVRGMDLSEYRVVHFATHGILASDVGCRTEPALVTSVPVAGENDPSDDGLLLSSEILELRLDADMVVLSACNTGGGDGSGGEALSGLARSFFYSGARSLLVSHWYVESGATRDLIAGMFKTLSDEPGVSSAEALRRSRIDLLSRAGRDRPDYWAHPAFWAGFTLVGEGGDRGF